jgi:hypothetical protein
MVGIGYSFSTSGEERVSRPNREWIDCGHVR